MPNNSDAIRKTLDAIRSAERMENETLRDMTVSELRRLLVELVREDAKE